MSARTGLLDVEVALLRAVQTTTALDAEPVPSTRVLAAIESSGLLGPRHAYSYLRDLAVPWHRHLPLVDGVGNWGSQGGDTAADARYTLVGLSALGVLALAAEQAEVAPVPFGLVDGTWWRGGQQPPFAPRDMLAALRTGDLSGLVPRPVTGGTVAGDLGALAAGRPARLVLGSVVMPERAALHPPPGMPPPGVEGGWWSSSSVPSPVHAPTVLVAASDPDPIPIDQLVITEVPYGVDTDEVIRQLAQRIQQEDGSTEQPPSYRGPSEPCLRFPCGPMHYVSDETSHVNGLRIVCVLRDGADPDASREWVLSTWPLTITADARLPRPLADLVTRWDAGDGSGLDALERLLDA